MKQEIQIRVQSSICNPVMLQYGRLCHVSFGCIFVGSTEGQSNVEKERRLVAPYEIHPPVKRSFQNEYFSMRVVSTNRALHKLKFPCPVCIDIVHQIGSEKKMLVEFFVVAGVPTSANQYTATNLVVVFGISLS